MWVSRRNFFLNVGAIDEQSCLLQYALRSMVEPSSS